MQGYITLGQLAAETGVDKANLSKFVRAQGIEFERVRSVEAGNQIVLALTVENAQRIKDIRAKAGYSLPSDAASESPVIAGNGGVLYVVQLDPDLYPARIKLGFASDVGTRLTDYRITNPLATVVDEYPCRRSWETAAIAALTNDDRVHHVGGEVYDVDDLSVLMKRGRQFFSMMPAPYLRG